MRNEDFKRLVALLESDPEALHGFLLKGTSKPEVDALLSDYCRAFAANTPAPAKLLNALFQDEADKANLMEAVAACVDSCEGSRLGAFDPTCVRFTCSATCQVTIEEAAGNPADFGGLDAVDPTCVRFTCSATCQVTMLGGDRAAWASNPVWAANLAQPVQRFVAAGCDANSTCSCTSGTCGGVTCGGSTCSATCTGDSCGNTCGDSCGYTTNIAGPFEMVRWFRQTEFWR